MGMYHRVALAGIVISVALMATGCADGALRRTAPGANINDYVRNTTVDGLMIALKVSRTSIELETAVPARIARLVPLPNDAGDRVVATTFWHGRVVSSATVQDPVVLIVEHEGQVRRVAREILFGIPTPEPIDTIEIRLSTNGTTARFEVRQAYDQLCREMPRQPVCADRT